MSTGVDQQFSSQRQWAKRFTAVDVVKAVVATVFIALFLSFIYGPIDYYSPLVYLNIALAYGMGWAVGRCAATMLRRFRIDSKNAAIAIGVIGGIAAVWASWLTYLWVVVGYNFQVFSGYANPFNLLEVMELIGENPIWSLSSRSGKSSSPGPAIMYYAFWLAELCIIVYAAVSECRSFVKNNKLCNLCGDWVRSTGETALFAIPDDADVLTSLQTGDLAVLPTLPRLADDNDHAHWLEARCFACGNCENENAHVTVALNAIKLDKNKKPQVVSTIMANLVEITPELEKAIFEPAQQKPEPAADSDPAADGDMTKTQPESEEGGDDNEDRE